MNTKPQTSNPARGWFDLELGASLVFGVRYLMLMTFRTLIRRSLRFHWRSHLGVVLGAAIGSAALIGALVVGDSVRESLREQALQRLGGVELRSGRRATGCFTMDLRWHELHAELQLSRRVGDASTRASIQLLDAVMQPWLSAAVTAADGRRVQIK